MAIISNSLRSNTVISGTAEADDIINYSDRVTINGGDGNDSITNRGYYCIVNGEGDHDTGVSQI